MIQIACIIVLYEPDYEKLKKVLCSIIQQVTRVFLIDNSSAKIDIKQFSDMPTRFDYIFLGGNKGVAYAQNKGIEEALKGGIDWVLLSDQDTVFPDNYIALFASKIEIYGKEKLYIPSFFNQIKNQKEAVSLSMTKSIRPNDNIPIEVFQAISSGTIFHKDIYLRIGGFLQILFIDYVDFEWCWRARYYGIEILCFPDIVINHQLGDSCKNILGKKVTIRSNFRYYYMIRNGLYLSGNCIYLTKSERYALLRRTIMFALGVVLISKGKIKTISLIRKAFLDVKEMGDNYTDDKKI